MRNEKPSPPKMVQCKKCDLIMPDYMAAEHVGKCQGGHKYGGQVKCPAFRQRARTTRRKGRSPVCRTVVPPDAGRGGERYRGDINDGWLITFN